MLSYCDFIADVIKTSLKDSAKAAGSLVSAVGGVNYDLHPQLGYFLSTKKTIEVADVNGKKYKVTITEID